ncbi:MAG TPA: hypothetical protein VG498_15755, partial [Terriglobales bacterium]|nr:hypothetical protein [Terriglobales bacterium]
MKERKAVIALLIAFCLLVPATRSYPQNKAAAPGVQVHLVITDMALQEDRELPRLQREDVKVKLGKNPA